MTKTYHVITYGCQMNKSDSQRISSIFEQYGCSAVSDPLLADFIILNTCSIKQSAEDRVYGVVRQFDKHRKSNPGLKIALTGCMIPRTDATSKAQGVDAMVSIKDLALLPEKLGLERPKSSVLVADYFNISPKQESGFQAYVPIMTGCNNFCTFCVVPFTRGREFSRPLIDVMSEVESAISKGAKEIMLLGQNVNSYKYGFVDLLKKINKLPGDFWVRFVSSNPQDMKPELIETVAECDKLAKYIHFAVQAGNDRILKKMNRRHTVHDYLKLYEQMKSLMPDIGVSTDIIVGFPSETAEEFEDTAKLMETVSYDMAYISQYSARTGTPAWRLNDDIPKDEKKKRADILNVILKRTAKSNAQRFLNKKARVLIDGLTHNAQLKGRDSGNRMVTIRNVSDQNLIGQFADVLITEILDFGLSGNII